MAFRCQAPARGCRSAWSPPERLPPGLIPCCGSPVTPATVPGRHSAAPAPRTFPKQPGRLPVITGCPNINVTLTQWPRSLPLPLVNLMDLLTSVPPRTATDFAAGQPLESKGQPAALRTVGKKGEMRLSGSSRSCPGGHALANALAIVCALQAPVTDLSFPPPPQEFPQLSAAPALSLLHSTFRRWPQMLQQPQRGLYRERRPPPTEKAGSAPSLIPPLRTAPPGPFHPYPYERRAKEPKVTAPTSVFHAK